MTTTKQLAMVLAAAALAFGPAARGGLLDSLKSKAQEEAKKRAIEEAKKKAAKMLSKKDAAPSEAEDKIMGIYVGTYSPAGGDAVGAEARVVGYGDRDKVRRWDIALTAGPADGKSVLDVQLKAQPDGEKAAFAGGDWTGQIAEGKLTATGAKGKIEAKLTVRQSPTLGAKPPAGAVVLLPYAEGKPTDLAAWTNGNWALLPDGSAMVQRGSNFTKKQFGSFKLHVEFRCPYEPDHTGQGRANSGVYMHGKYEVQVLDSFGLKPGGGDCGAIYGVSTPKVNASLPPGQWQTYDLVFHAPKFDGGKMTDKPTFVEVLHNGVKIHEDVKVGGITTAGHGTGHAPTGPMMLQDHGNPVRYRNIWLVEIDAGK